jgi:hypothetical protein
LGGLSANRLQENMERGLQKITTQEREERSVGRFKLMPWVKSNREGKKMNEYPNDGNHDYGRKELNSSECPELHHFCSIVTPEERRARLGRLTWRDGEENIFGLQALVIAMREDGCSRMKILF